MTDSNEFTRRLHSIDLNRGLGFESIVIKAMVIPKDSFSIPYSHEFHSTSKEKVLETLEDVPSIDCTSGTHGP